MKLFMLTIGPYIMPVLIGLLTGYLLNKKINKKIKELIDFYGEPATRKQLNRHTNKMCENHTDYDKKNNSLKAALLTHVFSKKE